MGASFLSDEVLRGEIARLRDDTSQAEVADLFEALLPAGDSCWQPEVQEVSGVAELFSAGSTLLSRAPISFDLEQLARRWLHVVEVVSKFMRVPEAATRQLLELEPARVSSLVSDLPLETARVIDQLMDAAPVGGVAATMILLETASPFYRAYAQAHALEDDVLERWEGGSCPVCGARPHWGLLEFETGARILECWLCSTRWGYPRLSCPFCGNVDQRQLEFFSVDGDERVRVHFCRQCASYLKIMDCRDDGREVALRVVLLASLIHDVAARHQGLQPGSELRLTADC